MNDCIDEQPKSGNRLDLSTAAIIALGGDFDYISAVNLDTQEEQIFKYNPAFMSLVPGWDQLKTYHDRMQVICNLFVHPNDRASFIHETDLSVLSETLTKDSPRKFVNFRELFGDSVVYYQGQYILLDTGDVKSCVVGFRNVDTETRNQIIQQSMEETISHDYECLLHVDFDSMQEDHYRVSKFFGSRIPGFEEEKNYLSRAKLLADTLVHPEDKERFLAEFDPAVVSEKVKGSVPYYVDFRVPLPTMLSRRTVRNSTISTPRAVGPSMRHSGCMQRMLLRKRAGKHHASLQPQQHPGSPCRGTAVHRDLPCCR